jgi:2-polyprenyl-3-methyl-5-hydroxy-6-metoxy-1,4-benzoquinol methylase
MRGLLTDKDKLILDLCIGKTVLDVGCVNHTVEETYKPLWKHGRIRSVAKELVGLDYERDAVRSLQERGFNVFYGDAQDFDLRDKFPSGFQVIIASEIIEHLKNPGAFLECMRRHLSKDGILLISTPHAFGIFFFAQILVFGEERFNDDHTLAFSRKNINHLLEKCGFKVKEFYWLVQDSSAGLNIGPKWVAKKIFLGIQLAVCTLIRKAFAKEMIVIAQPDNSESSKAS